MLAILKLNSSKLVSALFFINFSFSPNIALQKLWKMFFFFSKKLFSFSRFSNFCIFIFPLFFPVSHCLRGWFKKNLKIYDAINCLNKKLVTDFVWYLGKDIFNRQSYQKQKRSGTSDQLLFRLQNKFKNTPLFVIYYLTKFDVVIWSSFWVIPKNTSANLYKSIHDIINYFTLICPFESEKCGKEGKKLQKSE